MMCFPEMQVKAEPPDEENITSCRVYRDGVMGKLHLGDLSRTALRETP